MTKGIRNALTILIVSIASTAGAVPAFPGAEGFGSQTPGGRGGQVLFVTNLDDSGPGSLRAAIDTEGPRTVVFRTGGTIVLQSSLHVVHPFITIAGQSAPGGGIEIQNDPHGSRGRDSFASIVIDTHDVVIRYLRVRPGIPDEDMSCAEGTAEAGECVEPGDIDAISIVGEAHSIVIDHVSAGLATDEIIGAGSARDVTVQWSIIAEGINDMHYGPGKSYDGKGMLLGNYASTKRGTPSVRVSIHHNLWAHNSIRNPQISTACPWDGQAFACVSDVVNNVVYNWRHTATIVSNNNGPAYANVVGNTYIPGPDTIDDAGIDMRDWLSGTKILRPGSDISVFMDDNAGARADSDTPVRCYQMDPADGSGKAIKGHCDLQRYLPERRHAAPPVETQAADDAYARVIEEAGASRSIDGNGDWTDARDASDSRVIDDVEYGEGRIIDDVADIPARETRERGQALRDVDNDGMPNRYEKRFGLRPRHDSANDDTDGDGFTDLEEFLNGTPPVASHDRDGDNVWDDQDNCTGIANGPLQAHTVGNQCDTDRDGIGNVCDADLNNDGHMTFVDFVQLARAYGAREGDAAYNANADLDCNGAVGMSDVATMRRLFAK